MAGVAYGSSMGASLRQAGTTTVSPYGDGVAAPTHSCCCCPLTVADVRSSDGMLRYAGLVDQSSESGRLRPLCRYVLVGGGMSPAPTMRQVAFGRLNRRVPDQQSFARRPFAEDMRALAESRQTRAEIDEREWLAADLTVDVSGDFMTGILGYAEAELRRDFEDQAFSWIKGRTSMAEGASRRTTVPFAVDLREDRRWGSFRSKCAHPAGLISSRVRGRPEYRRCPSAALALRMGVRSRSAEKNCGRVDR